ncbi:hypothetical protein D3X11_02865 [Streptococcus sp. X16XC17]|uniref:hypothetical protein n=1 Tax=unclassified Streptococcus TaxID=2608887 RepID=UPI00066FD500|nr:MULTISPECIES: hypothetical protein [unclassified Streptococcus]TCD46379.1 hypothetical protein D3X11_02865 [Streptococcus sp. X16XC17]
MITDKETATWGVPKDELTQYLVVEVSDNNQTATIGDQVELSKKVYSVDVQETETTTEKSYIFTNVYNIPKIDLKVKMEI